MKKKPKETIARIFEHLFCTSRALTGVEITKDSKKPGKEWFVKLHQSQTNSKTLTPVGSYNQYKIIEGIDEPIKLNSVPIESGPDGLLARSISPYSAKFEIKIRKDPKNEKESWIELWNEVGLV
jgi:hypothetical protein